MIVLNTVKTELCRSKSLVPIVNNFIAFNKIEEMVFPHNNILILKAYAELIKDGRGEGESSIMAVARYNNQIIASSNLKDIKEYCISHKIIYITTMDILLDALEKKILDEAYCDYFIYKVKSSGSKLPVDSMQEYIRKFKS